MSSQSSMSSFPNMIRLKGTPSGKTHFCSQRRLTRLLTYFIKAVNQDTGEIIGIAKWLILQGQAAQPLSPGKLLESVEEKEYAEHLLSEYQKYRFEVIESTNGHLLSRSLSQASCAANWGISPRPPCR